MLYKKYILTTSTAEVRRTSSSRVIQNRQVLIIENSLRCVLSGSAEEAGYWAYHAAWDYAERYDPHYGTGFDPGISSFSQSDRRVLVRILRSGDLSQNILCHRLVA